MEDMVNLSMMRRDVTMMILAIAGKCLRDIRGIPSFHLQGIAALSGS